MQSSPLWRLSSQEKEEFMVCSNSSRVFDLFVQSSYLCIIDATPELVRCCYWKGYINFGKIEVTMYFWCHPALILPRLEKLKDLQKIDQTTKPYWTHAKAGWLYSAYSHEPCSSSNLYDCINNLSQCWTGPKIEIYGPTSQRCTPKCLMRRFANCTTVCQDGPENLEEEKGRQFHFSLRGHNRPASIYTHEYKKLCPFFAIGVPVRCECPMPSDQSLHPQMWIYICDLKLINTITIRLRNVCMQLMFLAGIGLMMASLATIAVPRLVNWLTHVSATHNTQRTKPEALDGLNSILTF